MKRKDFFLDVIAHNFSDILEPIGFEFDLKNEIYNINQPWGYDQLVIDVLNYGKSKSIGPIFYRRFNCIEEIIEKHYSYLLPGSNFKDTLRVEENRLDLLISQNKTYVNRKNYMIIDYDESIYYPNIEYLKKLWIDRIFPFLKNMETLDNLHEFINNPVDRLDIFLNFFPLDGMTPFRKMIIAKFAHKEKDYKKICDFVNTYFLDIYERPTDEEEKERYYKFLQVYKEVKELLDYK